MSDDIPHAAPEGHAPADASPSAEPAVDIAERSALAPEPPPLPSWAGRYREPLRKLDLLVLLAILAVTAVVHLARLGAPGDVLRPGNESCTKYPPIGPVCHEMIPLDEVHYVPDARDVLRFGTESDKRAPGDSGSFVVHPPVGKWFIAAGIKALGDTPAGWRLFGAIFGSVAVVVMYLLARRLWASPWWAAMAALLLGVEGLWFVQSRVAMLDIYAAFFVLLGVWLLLEDLGRALPQHRGPRGWRIASGIAFGFALATKWSVLPFLGVAIVLALAWEVGAARYLHRIGMPPRRGALTRAILRRTGAVFGVFLVLPAALYVATYTPWFVDGQRYDPPLCAGRDGLHVRWLCYQREMANFHRNLEKYEVEEKTENGETITETKPAHPYFGHGSTWPWIGRPVAHAYETTGKGDAERARHVLGLPNPAIWWPAFALALIAPLWWAGRRVAVLFSRRIGWPEPKRDPVLLILVLFFLAGAAPYVAADLVDRPVFMFYATPLVPFLVLMVVHFFVRTVARWPEATWFALGYTAVAVATFAYFYPVLAAVPIPLDGVLGWRARMWLTADCSTVKDAIKVLCWI